MNDIIKLERIAIKLKEVRRKGWLISGIKNPESVAEHCFSVSFFVMLMAKKLNLNIEKALMLSLVHDFAEAEIGDITPHDKNYKVKDMLEIEAIKKIADETDSVFLLELFKEYQENKTKEANFVHDADKLEMIFQAREYIKKYPEKDLQEFFSYVKDKLFFDESKLIYEELVKEK